MAGRLSGKIALVTGIGGGIGKGCAMLFAREGATVIGCDINPQWAETTQSEAKAEGLTIDSLHPLDLTRPADVQTFIDHAAKAHGRIDILVNAAAIPPHMGTTEAMDYETEWTPTMVGEVDIVFLACKAAWPWLKASGRASVINFASVNARRASAVFGMVAHCAGKGAVEAMSRQMAREGGPQGIRVNTIAPGMVVTPATIMAGAGEDANKAAILSRVPMGRFGQPEDIGWCAVYLASDEATWVTGANFAIDGGTMAS